jgi:hypothetical protein
MMDERATTVGRRGFLVGVGAIGTEMLPDAAWAAGGSVAIVADPVVASRPVTWAIDRLRGALAAKGIAVSPSEAGAAHVVAVRRLADLGPESISIVASGRQTIVGSGAPRGLTYGLLELAERVEAATDPLRALAPASPIRQEPATRVRSILRAFCSDVEDKPWFYDKDYWSGYLDLLAASRFNRMQFALGFGYDFPSGVTEDYFHFPYPYLVTVPGYDVHVVPLEPGERERNLEMLKFVATETAARGMEFQLGIWTHAYQWTDSPNAHHHITGLTPQNHAAYCRDALALLLKECPEITGLSMRVHGESGIPEGSYDFWRTVLQAIADCPRPIEIDMHAKGINDIMIDMAARTGKPVKVAPKYSAEHQSLGYHQADIRELEIPRADRMETGTFAVSNGDRRFTRYGYADLFKEGRKYDVLFRRWAGTQRHLMNGDPAQAAAYGRSASFCGAAGIEICEPLTYKGRNGSGHPGGRCAYLNRALDPGRNDWAKFAYAYRLWGHALYAPDAEPESARRHLAASFGPAAPAMERAMADASRVLLLLTSAHLYSASNRGSWYENFSNVPIVVGSEATASRDTPRPWSAATVSPLDPQLFSSIVDHVGELLGGRRSARYSPVEVAGWMEAWSDGADKALAEATAAQRGAPAMDFRRWEEDIRIQIGLGRFFAGRLRAATLYEIFGRTGDPDAGGRAIATYRAARQAWATMAERARTIYVADIGYGEPAVSRGHWIDRLPAIDRDLEAMVLAVGDLAGSKPLPDPAIRAATAAAAGTEARWRADCTHAAPASFAAGSPLALKLETSAQAVDLWYRHVNHGERWRSMAMAGDGGRFHASIPGDYTNSPYPLQYYFVIHGSAAAPVFHPAFDADLSNQPYFAVWKRHAAT